MQEHYLATAEVFVVATIISTILTIYVFFGWVFGNIIVLVTLGNVLTVVLNPVIIRSRIFVRKFLS